MTLPSQGMPEYRHTVFKRKARICGNACFALFFEASDICRKISYFPLLQITLKF